MRSQNTSTVGQPRGRGGRNDLLAHERNVVVGPARIFRRNRVRGEQRGTNVDALSVAEGACHAQQLELARGVEAVTGLDLDRGDAFAAQALQPFSARAQQLVLGGGPRRAHRCHDAAACARDLLVGRAGQALLELARAIAGVDEVRVAVDETRREPAPAAVELLARGEVGRHLGARADPGDAPVAHGERAVANRAVRRSRRHRCEMNVDDQPVAARHASSRFIVWRYRARIASSSA